METKTSNKTILCESDESMETFLSTFRGYINDENRKEIIFLLSDKYHSLGDEFLKIRYDIEEKHVNGDERLKSLCVKLLAFRDEIKQSEHLFSQPHDEFEALIFSDETKAKHMKKIIKVKVELLSLKNKMQTYIKMNEDLIDDVRCYSKLKKNNALKPIAKDVLKAKQEVEQPKPVEQKVEKPKRDYVFTTPPYYEMISIVNYISDIREFKNIVEKLVSADDLETSLDEFVEQQPDHLNRLYRSLCTAHCKLFHDGKPHRSDYEFLNEHLQTATGEPTYLYNEFDNKFGFARSIKHDRKCQTHVVKSLDSDLAEKVLATHEKVYQERKDKFLKMWCELSKVIDDCVAELQQRLSLTIEKLNA